MTSKQQKRFFSILFIVIGCAVSAGLILYAFSNHIDLYYSPSEYSDLPTPYAKTIRVGGMVVKDSIKRGEECCSINFQITDFEKTLTISYKGILPDLFREGQGVVVLGKKSADDYLEATQVLAKHDENYMPPEVARHNKQVKHAT